MTPKRTEDRNKTSNSDLDHCVSFSAVLKVLAVKQCAKQNIKFGDLLKKISLSQRNWKRIISGEVVPSIQTFKSLRRELCDIEDNDKFDAMYIKATSCKERFSENDINELIEIGSGIKCNRKDTLDPKCFRAIAFSNSIHLDSEQNSEKALAFFQSMRSLLISRRLPARSDADRKIRIAIIMHREAWVARAMNKIALQEKLLRSIENLKADEISTYMRATIIDYRLLATNSPDEVFFPILDKPAIDSHVAGFQKSLELFRVYDSSPNDPLQEYGFAGTADDAQINLLRLACLYGTDEAGTALSELSVIQGRDEERGAERFLTIYNDLLEIEALITIGSLTSALDKIHALEIETTAMGRSDLFGEVRMLLAKTFIKRKKPSKEDFAEGIKVVESVIRYFSEIGNDTKVWSVQKTLRQIDGVRLAKFG